MSKNVHYLLLLMALIVPAAGCETVKGTASGAASGAASGLSKDVYNAADPDKNGWHIIKKADAWMQKNLW